MDSEPSTSRSEELLPHELAELGPDELLINEFFLSIQGESTFAGWPCFFIRLAGCHLRCTYCDTEYAFHQGSKVSLAECLERARASDVGLVEVTGGEPLLQKAVHPLLSQLADEGYRVLLETGGAIEVRTVDPRVHKIVDVKCPTSHMAERNHPDLASSLGPLDELKFVIGDRDDYLWARAWLDARASELPPDIPVHFSPIHSTLAARDLAAWMLEDRLRVRLNLQVHKIIWPDLERGV